MTTTATAPATATATATALTLATTLATALATKLTTAPVTHRNQQPSNEKGGIAKNENYDPLLRPQP
jgi:hypothetical protein